MADPIFASYYTPNYRKAAKQLEASLDEFGLRKFVIPVTSEGSWRQNTYLKPWLVRTVLKKNPDSPVVWVDADAIVRKHPKELFEVSSDVAFVSWIRPDTGTEEIICGTIYFANTPEALFFIDTWADLIAHITPWADQGVILETKQRCRDVTFSYLPIEYNFIFDTHRKHFPDQEPVIEHFQLSRAERHR